MTQSPNERFLTPSEVGFILRVDPKTVSRWAKAGKISSIRTPGGHRRFRESDIRALLDAPPAEPMPPAARRPPDVPARLYYDGRYNSGRI